VHKENKKKIAEGWERAGGRRKSGNTGAGGCCRINLRSILAKTRGEVKRGRETEKSTAPGREGRAKWSTVAHIKETVVPLPGSGRGTKAKRRGGGAQKERIALAKRKVIDSIARLSWAAAAPAGPPG